MENRLIWLFVLFMGIVYASPTYLDIGVCVNYTDSNGTIVEFCNAYNISSDIIILDYNNETLTIDNKTIRAVPYPMYNQTVYINYSQNFSFERLNLSIIGSKYPKYNQTINVEHNQVIILNDSNITISGPKIPMYNISKTIGCSQNLNITEANISIDAISCVNETKNLTYSGTVINTIYGYQYTCPPYPRRDIIVELTQDNKNYTWPEAGLVVWSRFDPPVECEECEACPECPTCQECPVCEQAPSSALDNATVAATACSLIKYESLNGTNISYCPDKITTLCSIEQRTGGMTMLEDCFNNVMKATVERDAECRAELTDTKILLESKAESVRFTDEMLKTILYSLAIALVLFGLTLIAIWTLMYLSLIHI